MKQLIFNFDTNSIDFEDCSNIINEKIIEAQTIINSSQLIFEEF